MSKYNSFCFDEFYTESWRKTVLYLNFSAFGVCVISFFFQFASHPKSEELMFKLVGFQFMKISYKCFYNKRGNNNVEGRKMSLK